MEKKSPEKSAVENHTYKVFPNDLNSHGTVFGGVIMSICDRVAVVVAERHSEKTCATVIVDKILFLKPAGNDDILLFSASINRSWKASMEIGIKVEAENYRTQHKRHILSAYFIFVAVDENQKLIEVPEVLPTTPNEIRRYAEAEIRRKNRRKEAINHKKASKKPVSNMPQDV